MNAWLADFVNYEEREELLLDNLESFLSQFSNRHFFSPQESANFSIRNLDVAVLLW